MLSVIDKREWSDIKVGTLVDAIPSGRSEALVRIKYEVGIRPFPEAPFIFCIGGISTVSGKSVDSREIVFCKEVVETGVYRVQRDPLQTGILPKSHAKGEPVFATTPAGTLFGLLRQQENMARLEGQIAYLEDLLLVLFGDSTTVIENLWPEYDHFCVKATNPPSQEVSVEPGGFFVKKTGENKAFTRLLVVAPGTQILNKSRIQMIFPDKGKKRRGLVYITDDGGIAVGYGPEVSRPDQDPPHVSVSSSVYQVLAEVLLDATQETPVVSAKSVVDMRPWKK